MKMPLQLNYACVVIQWINKKPIHVYYRNQIIGEYFADLIVNDLVILELKAVRSLQKQHEAQLLNYLKATKFEVGLLLNFGPLPKQVRKAFDNHNKPHLFAETAS